MVVYTSISVSWSESLCQDREKDAVMLIFFHAYLVIAINTSINIVYLLVNAVILRLQNEILRPRWIFLKIRKVFRINTTGFNSEHLQ